MTKFNQYSVIMEKVSGTNKLKDSNREVEVIYDVFKDTCKYMSPEIYRMCTKTAVDVAYHICSTIKHNQTSIKLTTTDLIESDVVKSKSQPQLHNALRELMDKGVLVRWKDIEELPNKERISKSWYLLNPTMIKAIGCKNFKEQVEVTVRCITSVENYNINEFSAIVYNFKINNGRCNRCFDD